MMDKRKGGRPPKRESDKLTYQVNVRFKPLLYFKLEMRAKRCNMPLKDYVRSCVENSRVTPRFSPQEMLHIRNLYNMGNNLNQLTKRAHQTGCSELQHECRELIKRIDNEINLMTK